MPRGIVIAGVSSGVGKTTISLAIMHGLRAKGLAVQPFKVGPDFIDPSYHERAAGRPSRNLDPWLMGKPALMRSYAVNSKSAEISVIEGVMGLYDGMSGKNDYASTAYVAKLLELPVILVLDASKSARSLAAVALGFVKLDPRVKISGLIINNVAGPRHSIFVREAIGSTVKLPILGMISRFSPNEQALSERHLGLVPTRELKKAQLRRISSIARIVGNQIDYDGILEHAGLPSRALLRLADRIERTRDTKAKTRMAVALDESFNFYYYDNLDLLRQFGAELEFFSPVNDSKVPDSCNGLLLGGGFPEVLADRLEKNSSMLKSIRKNVDDGMPVYAECGGLMYLTRSISSYEGSRRHMKMIGAIDADTVMRSRLTLGYTDAECVAGLFTGISLRGHEFHYSAIENISKDSRLAYRMKRGTGVQDNQDGFLVRQHGIASYTHVHFQGVPKIPARLVDACSHYSRK